MKKTLLFLSIVVMVVALSCQYNETAQNPEAKTLSISPGQTSTSPGGRTAPLFNERVGAAIPAQTKGKPWMNNYVAANGSARQYFLSATTLADALALPNVVGLSLCYAQDEQGQLHIVPVGVTSQGSQVAQPTVVLQNQTIAWTTAQQWMANYTGSVKAHFFGRNTFTRLLHQQQTQTVRIDFALDDEALPVLLLSNAAIAEPASFEDAALLCPPYCKQ